MIRGFVFDKLLQSFEQTFANATLEVLPAFVKNYVAFQIQHFLEFLFAYRTCHRLFCCDMSVFLFFHSLVQKFNSVPIVFLCGDSII